MNEETNELIDYTIHGQEEEIFLGFMTLRSIYFQKNKKKISKEEIEFVYKNYAKLLAERKRLLSYKTRLEALNGFMGLR